MEEAYPKNHHEEKQLYIGPVHVPQGNLQVQTWLLLPSISLVAGMSGVPNDLCLHVFVYAFMTKVYKRING